MQTKASCAGRGHPARALRRPKVCRGQRGAHSRGLKRQQGGWANRRLALPPLRGELSPDGGGLVTLSTMARSDGGPSGPWIWQRTGVSLLILNLVNAVVKNQIKVKRKENKKWGS